MRWKWLKDGMFWDLIKINFCPNRKEGNLWGRDKNKWVLRRVLHHFHCRKIGKNWKNQRIYRKWVIGWEEIT